MPLSVNSGRMTRDQLRQLERDERIKTARQMREIQTRKDIAEAGDRTTLQRARMADRNQLAVAQQYGRNQVAATRAQGANAQALQESGQEFQAQRDVERFNRERGVQLQDRVESRRQQMEDAAAQRGINTYLATGDPTIAAQIQGSSLGGYVDYSGAKKFTPDNSWGVERVGGSSSDPLYARVNRRSGEFYDSDLEELLKKRRKELLNY